MFLFKKFISPLFLPLSISVLMLLQGLAYLQSRRRQRKGKLFISLGIILLLISSYEVISDIMLRSLEDRYRPINIADVKSPKSVKWIVVLGGGINSDPKLPITEQLSNASMARLIEGVRLHKQLPGSRILLSGGVVFKARSEASIMAGVASAVFDIKNKDIALESQSRDTEDQAARIRGIVGKDPFILVTSAFHMHRSVTLFRKIGLNPIPAPAQFMASAGTGEITPEMFYPQAKGLLKSEYVFHEYLGMLWAKLRGNL